MDKLDALGSTFHNFCSIIASAEAANINHRGGGSSGSGSSGGGVSMDNDHLPPPPSPDGSGYEDDSTIHTSHTTHTAHSHVSTNSTGNVNINTNTISPMKMLSRGYLGQEVSLLVQYVQLHKNTISNTTTQLKCLKTELRSVIQNSLNELDRKQKIVEIGLEKVNDFLKYENI